MKGLMLVVAALLFAVVAHGQYVQPDLYPITNNGFDTILITDMSFVTQIGFETGFPENLTFFIFGQNSVRTVNPWPNFYVSGSPNFDWNLPFIDLHSFVWDGNLWGMGPIEPVFNHGVYGYTIEIAAITTRPGSNRNIRFPAFPPGLEASFFGAHAAIFNFTYNSTQFTTNLLYLAGYMPNNNTGMLEFSLMRAHLNTTYFASNSGEGAGFTYTPADICVLRNNTMFYTYSPQIKPIIHHVFNSTTAPNTTGIVVVDPGSNHVFLVESNYADYTQPLTIAGIWNALPFGTGFFMTISSAVVWNNHLIVGVVAAGTQTGWISILFLANLTEYQRINLPANYSDPRALIVDHNDLYVGMNGGPAIIKISLSTFTIVGQQNLPDYLHRVWAGVATPEHLIFVTNEQHTKVFRLNKKDFCVNTCPGFGFCSAGACACPSNMELKSGECQWKTVVRDNTIIKREKGGEAALGVFFALALVAAAVGWYMVWRQKRSSYTAV